jgi:hypothetical protein
LSQTELSRCSNNLSKCFAFNYSIGGYSDGFTDRCVSIINYIDICRSYSGSWNGCVNYGSSNWAWVWRDWYKLRGDFDSSFNNCVVLWDTNSKVELIWLQALRRHVSKGEHSLCWGNRCSCLNNTWDLKLNSICACLEICSSKSYCPLKCWSIKSCGYVLKDRKVTRVGPSTSLCCTCCFLWCFKEHNHISFLCSWSWYDIWVDPTSDHCWICCLNEAIDAIYSSIGTYLNWVVSIHISKVLSIDS